MQSNLLFGAAALLALASVAVATDRTLTFNYQSSVTSDANGPLDLFTELNYNDAVANAPIAVVMHGYSNTSTALSDYRPNAQRLRNQGFFVLTVAMRGRTVNVVEGVSRTTDGVRDSGGVEIYDIYDAVESAKAAYGSLVDPSRIYITGYSGGGGNVMSALTKFPDYFNAGASFFGMSDYGYNATNGWYNNGATSSRQPQLNADIGNPNTGGAAVLDKYLARASNLASKNNPYSEIHLFYNSNESICPPINDTSYRNNAAGAQSYAGEFNNITLHPGQTGAYHDFNGNGMDEANEQQYWPHHAPTSDEQTAAEQWFLGRLLSGAIAAPVLNESDTLFVAGYVRTKKFGLWLGDGQNAAGDLTYTLGDEQMSFNLSLASSDKLVLGVLDIDTARMAGQTVDVLVNNEWAETITGGGLYRRSDFGDGDLLVLQAVPEPSTLGLLVAFVVAIVFAARRRRNLAP